jgi:copper resistance protein D
MGGADSIIEMALKALLYGCALGSAGIALSVVGTIIEPARQAAWLRVGALLALGAMIVAGARVVFGSFQLGDMSLVGMVWEAQRASAIAIAGACLALTLACFMFGPLRALSSLVGAILVATSFGLTGHTYALTEKGFWPFVVAGHVMIASFWLVAPFVLWPRSALVDEEIALKVERFGKIAVIAVPFIFVGGIALAVTLAGSFAKLVASAYGLLIGLKVLAACAALGLGAVNKLRVGKMLASSPQTGRRLLAQTLSADIVLFGIAIVAIALATTVFGPPP